MIKLFILLWYIGYRYQTYRGDLFAILFLDQANTKNNRTNKKEKLEENIIKKL